MTEKLEKAIARHHRREANTCRKDAIADLRDAIAAIKTDKDDDIASGHILDAMQRLAEARGLRNAATDIEEGNWK